MLLPLALAFLIPARTRSTDAITLKLGERTDDLKQQLSRCCSEVEAFGKADQLDTDAAEFLQELYEMQQTAS